MKSTDHQPMLGTPNNGLYNLVVTYVDGQWTGVKKEFPRDRLFEYTDYELAQKYKPFDERVQIELMTYPTVFTEEVNSEKIGLAHIGWITKLLVSGRYVRIEYQLPSLIPPLPADKLARALGIEPFPRGIGEMQRNHWAVKKGDLFSVLFRAGFLETAKPSFLQIPTDSFPPNLVSVMMPFGPNYKEVCRSLKATCKRLKVPCERADDIWEDSVVIQDIFSLIYRSKVVICDFSEQKPNVFYEAGLAHALGRDVIPIVRREDADHMPFDLGQHRYIPYSNDEEGLEELEAEIEPRIKTLIRR